LKDEKRESTGNFLATRTCSFKDCIRVLYKIRTIFSRGLTPALLTAASLLYLPDLRSQDTSAKRFIPFPLTQDVISLFNSTAIRYEYEKTEIRPEDLVKRNFKPLKSYFSSDSLHFSKNIQTVWFKFGLHNNLSVDTAVALLFPRGVNKAVLYKCDSNGIHLVGKTGFGLAVLKRNVPYEDNRIDIPLKALSLTEYFIQVPRIEFNYMLSRAPALESIAKAELIAFSKEKETNRYFYLWAHLFTGIFVMFFVFGMIKCLVNGNDKAYLYFSLLGLFNAMMSIADAEFPPLEISYFENFRGIELLNLLTALAILMQGLFIVEILQLKSRNSRATLIVKGFLYLQLLIAALYTLAWVAGKQYRAIFHPINTSVKALLLILVLLWTAYLATIRKGFYQYIFLGALTISFAFTIMFFVQFFKMYHLLPSWFGDDPRSSVYHFMQIALVVDMCFYFIGLAHRDREIEKDKIHFQAQLIDQLESNKQLQEAFTAQLEQQVREQTSALLMQHQALEAEKEAKLLSNFNRKLSESELKALRSQMNPHFIFNILNTIESYTLENNKEAASTMIQKFSRLTRLVLENSMNQLVPFEKDWAALQLYVELEMMRFPELFQVVYDVDEVLLSDHYFIPPMLIQPFVENAIIHGLRNKSEQNRELYISAKYKEQYIRIQVRDNGIGRRRSAELKANNLTSKISLGVKVTQERIHIFNKINQDRKASIEITDLECGTSVELRYPILRPPVPPLNES
jgi:sensor histidine kinase YesM